MITSVRFCLSYDLLNVILLTSKFVYSNGNLHCCNGRHDITCSLFCLKEINLHCCNGRRHDVTCSRRKCYVTCGHNIIYDMMLPTE